MSLAKIKTCLKKVREDESSLCWVEEEIADLLYAIAEHLLELGKEHETTPSAVPAGWLRLIDFIKEEKIFPYGSVSSMIARNQDFRERFTMHINGKLYVDPIATNAELRKSTKIKNMLARFNCS